MSAASEKKISVIVPCMNVAPWLPRCLKSVLSSLPGNAEVVAVDDGSTDSTGKILEETAKSDPRLKVISQGNRGVSAARNVGMEHSSGEFVFFVDPDDYVEPDFFSSMISAIEGARADYCVCAFKTQKDGESGFAFSPLKGNYRFASNEEIVASYVPRIFGYSFDDVARWYAGERLFAPREMASVCRGCFRREIIERFSVRFDESVSLYEDSVFNVEYLLSCRSMTSVDKPLYVVTERSSGAMRTIPRNARRFYPNKLRLLEARKRLDCKSSGRLAEMYTASCVFSALEILAGLVRMRMPPAMGAGLLVQYLADPVVSSSVRRFPLSPRRPVWAAAVLFLRFVSAGIDAFGKSFRKRRIHG